MRPIKRILITTDFSDCSQEALDYAVHLARNLKADLFLLHVSEPPFYPPAGGSLQVPHEIRRWIDELKKNAAKRLNTLADAVRNQGVKVQPMFKEGTPFLEILKSAEEIPADLIVLGSHGRTGMDYFLMGSVAERVMGKAPCAVFMVRPKAIAKKAEKKK